MNRPITLVLALVGGAGLLGAVAPAAPQVRAPRVLSFQEMMQGNDDRSLRWPVAVAAASDAEVAVADAFSPRLLRFRRVGVSWQLDRTVELGAAPVDLVWDGARYVAALRKEGGLAAFEGEDLAERRLRLPRGVVPGALAAAPAGGLLVYDRAGARVLRLSASGEIQGEVAIPEGQVSALAAAPSGGFLAAVPAEGKVLRIDASGTLGASFALPPSDEGPAWPSGLAVDPGGDLLVVDRHAGQILVLDASGRVKGLGSRKGWEPGLLLFPRGVARLPGGLVVVADEGNGRAQLFRRTDSGELP